MKSSNNPKIQVYIILVNCQDKIKSWEELLEKKLLEEKLKPIDFTGIIEEHFKKVVKRNGRHLTLMAPTFKAYCGTGNELTTTIDIDIYGEDGLYEFISLAKENGWQMLDKALDDFIDLDFPLKWNYSEYKRLKLKEKNK